MSSQEFLTSPYGALPEFFTDESDLRLLWSKTAPRRSLLVRLTEKGNGPDVLTEQQQLIDADNSDLFDVLPHVANSGRSFGSGSGARHGPPHRTWGDQPSKSPAESVNSNPRTRRNDHRDRQQNQDGQGPAGRCRDLAVAIAPLIRSMAERGSKLSAEIVSVHPPWGIDSLSR